MRRFVGIVALLVFGFVSGRALADPPVYQFQQMDKDVPVDQLAGPGIQINKLGVKRGVWKLPSVTEREEAFYHSGLRPDIASWDQLDRDMLYLRARGTSLKKLSEQYPKLAPSKLKSLHRWLRGR